MAKKSATVRYTAKQIKAMITLGEDRTNWALTDEVTGARLEDSIRADADEAESEPDWTQAMMGVPAPKDHINIRIDLPIAFPRGFQYQKFRRPELDGHVCELEAHSLKLAYLLTELHPIHGPLSR